MREETVRVIVKEPGKSAYDLVISNDLKQYQRLVGGYIEPFTVCSDFIILCNETGTIDGLPFNVQMFGNPFYGTIVLVGVTRSGEFCSVPDAVRDLLWFLWL